MLKQSSTALILCARQAERSVLSTDPLGSLGGFDTQLLERRHDVRSVRSGIHLLVDVQDLAVFANVKRPTKRKLPFRGNNTIATGHLPAGIAEDGIVQFE